MQELWGFFVEKLSKFESKDSNDEENAEENEINLAF
jgi:hypothetical protein